MAVAEAQAFASSESINNDDSGDDWVIPVVIIIVILVLAGVGVGGFFLYKKIKAKEQASLGKTKI